MNINSFQLMAVNDRLYSLILYELEKVKKK